jgi:hypothetical protein
MSKTVLMHRYQCHIGPYGRTAVYEMVRHIADDLSVSYVVRHSINGGAESDETKVFGKEVFPPFAEETFYKLEEANARFIGLVNERVI